MDSGKNNTRDLDRHVTFEEFEPVIALSGIGVVDPLADAPAEPAPESDSVYQAGFSFGKASGSLTSAHDATGVSYVHENYGFTGAGQTVAIIDSGIAWDHYALGGGLGEDFRVVGGYDFAENDFDPYDDGPQSYHGTHVAGILGSTEQDALGVAPGVDIVGLRVFDDAGQSEIEWIENALRWVHDNQHSFENSITTVNMSIGVRLESDAATMLQLDDELKMLEDDGIYISISAGNSFATAAPNELSYPASSQYATAAASVDADGNISRFSQRAEKVIAAPGERISSTVPSHVFGMNGPAKYFATSSGTSMAAPYMAGASVLVREAMTFAGHEDITQDDIYDQLYNTADDVFDSETGGTYKRLNLQAAIDDLMTDDFGSTAADAHNLGAIAGGENISGMLGKTGDLDYFTFTATGNGTATFTAEVSTAINAQWRIADSGGESTGVVAGDSLQLEVVEGNTYTFAISSPDGTGSYSIGAAFEAAPAPIEVEPVDAEPEAVDWGAISSQLSSSESVAGEARYAFAASSNGILTVEAAFAHASGDVNLELYSGDELVATSQNSHGSERIDFDAYEGQLFELRATGANDNVNLSVTNMVRVEDGLVTVNGGAGDDTFAFVAGAQHQLTVNGVDYTFDAEEVTAVAFTGGGGADSISLTGSAAKDTAILNDGAASLTSSGYSVSAEGFAVIDAYSGGGVDKAYLYGTAGAEHFAAEATAATMTGDGFQNSAHGFNRTYAYGNGGHDTAALTGTAGNDYYYSRAQYSTMQGAGYYNYARGFEQVTATGGGGYDTTRMLDTAGDEHLSASPGEATMTGSDYQNTARGFTRVDIYASSGHDTATLYDSAGSDHFIGRANASVMRGAGFMNIVTGFDAVRAVASSGYDTATFLDSAGDDVFTGHHDHATLVTTGNELRADGFTRVNAYSNAGGNDSAIQYDSAGADTYISSTRHSMMQGRGFYNRATGFTTVQAYSSGGGDSALLYGSSANETFVTSSGVSEMRHENGVARVSNFASVRIIGGGGYDNAVLQNVATGSVLSGRGHYFSLLGSGQKVEATGIDEVAAHAATSANPVDETSAIDFIFNQYGDWE